MDNYLSNKQTKSSSFSFFTEKERGLGLYIGIIIEHNKMSKFCNKMSTKMSIFFVQQNVKISYSDVIFDDVTRTCYTNFSFQTTRYII